MGATSSILCAGNEVPKIELPALEPASEERWLGPEPEKHIELRCMYQVDVYQRHESARQLVLKFYAWNPKLDRHYMSRRIKQHGDMCFLSRSNAELNSFLEWRFVVDETLGEAERMAHEDHNDEEWCWQRLEFLRKDLSLPIEHWALQGLRPGETLKQLSDKVSTVDKLRVSQKVRSVLNEPTCGD